MQKNRMLVLLLPALAAAATGAIFGARSIHQTGPYVQIVGHHAPLGAQPALVGNSRNCDLCLTESGVASEHGWIVRNGSAADYVQASATDPAQLASDRWNGDIVWNSFDRIDDGDVINVTGNAAAGSHAVDLIDGSPIELRSADGARHLTMLAQSNGEAVSLPETDGTEKAALSYCDGAVVFTTAGCGSKRPFSLFARVRLFLGLPVTIPPAIAVPTWLRGGTIRIRRTSEKRYLRSKDDRIIPIPDWNGVASFDDSKGFVVYRTGGDDPRPRIARSGPPAVRVHLTHPKDDPIEVGRTPLTAGNILILGSTYFRTRIAPGASAIDLETVEKFDRFHFFYSLSAGRLNFSNRTVPLDRTGKRLAVQASTGSQPHSALPPDRLPRQNVAVTGWSVPAPKWMTADPRFPSGRAILHVADLQVDKAALRAFPLQTTPWSALTDDRGNVISALTDGGRARFAGHRVLYRNEVPRFEQIVPPLLFITALALLGMRCARAIFAGPRTANAAAHKRQQLFCLIAATAVCVVWTLLVVGVLLMGHMASVDRLIGKPDYYHRQLFYSILTAAVITSIIEGGTARARGDNLAVVGWIGFPLSLPSLLYSVVVVLAWQILDAASFLLAAPDRIPTDSAVFTQLAAGTLLLLIFISGVRTAFVSTSERTARTGTALAAALLLLSILPLLLAHAFVLVTCAFVGFLLLVGALAIRWPAAWDAEETAVRGGVAAATYAELTRRVRDAWAFSRPRPLVLLALGLMTLLAGWVLSSGRGTGGVKPAEFAVWFLAPGIAAYLTSAFIPRRMTAAPTAAVWKGVRFVARWFRRVVLAGLALLFLAGALYVQVIGWKLLLIALLPPMLLMGASELLRVRQEQEPEGERRQFGEKVAAYDGVLMIVVLIEVVVIASYVLQGDFGPLLVLVPSIVVLVAIWAVAPDVETPADAPAPPAAEWRLRLPVAAVFVLVLVWGISAGTTFVRSDWGRDLPTIGESVARASKRFVSAEHPWFTKEGSWSVSALWIANARYANETMLANLHSDLAFIALIEIFGRGRAAAVLALYLVLIIGCLAGIAVGYVRASAETADVNTRRSLRYAALLLYFTSCYVLLELVVHIGSAFNAIPQTGVTLPWISSGGSASIGFGGVCAIAIAVAVSSAHRITPPPPAQGGSR
jgi:hypothetical protein